MPATERGIYHNLSESKYAVSCEGTAFFFSSKFYLNKFVDEYQNHRKKFTKRMKPLLNEKYWNLELLADLTLYQDIERRGFRFRVRNIEFDQKQASFYALNLLNQDVHFNWDKRVDNL